MRQKANWQIATRPMSTLMWSAWLLNIRVLTEAGRRVRGRCTQNPPYPPNLARLGQRGRERQRPARRYHDRRPGPDQSPRARDALGEQGSLHSKRVFYAGVTRTPTEAMIGFLEEFGLMLRLETKQISDENYKIYGVCKACQQLKRECCTLAFCTLERLMTQIGIRGAVCGKAVNTTIPYAAALCPHKKVNHVFLAPAPTFSGSSI